MYLDITQLFLYVHFDARRFGCQQSSSTLFFLMGDILNFKTNLTPSSGQTGQLNSAR